ncbi:3-deoxy-manno-octulosonate cytidylyltransferase [Kiloniella laminariae]|uniref:3-deoxy-manno-octulosonate cytidylyltransferase n=1 Tax=Kiloniella laminariae TaxID=454162 RepID=A0ABT4LMI2_9PROT|nr:3-deoxy-manno-octulosonate cytidylyltransferase [Kiloniella laminariae]MCZ4281581.1 3-deoxy-manno-octulosonate cytidylyltransferase [Kiloniella laminariae]
MSLPLNPVVLIPARMASSRLPNKPLADICGLPMIVQCYKRAVEAGLGPVVVACAEQEIAEAVEKFGGKAVLTDPAHPSGSDRIHEALQLFDPKGNHDAVVNVQGDLPTVEPHLIRTAFEVLNNPEVDIATLAVEIRDEEERHNPNVVKAVAGFEAGQKVARALYFSRSTAPWDDGDVTKPLYHHIGLYAYRRQALEHFVAMPASPLEKREKLEQLRALEAGMRIDIALVDTVPLGVDTPADLERARQLLSV